MTYIITSKWIKNSNIRPKSIKPLGGKIEQKLYNIGFSNDFLNVPPKAQVTKLKMDKLWFIKI